jgi:hypothetical protein
MLEEAPECSLVCRKRGVQSGEVDGRELAVDAS